jgi:hypothetical protein
MFKRSVTVLARSGKIHSVRVSSRDRNGLKVSKSAAVVDVDGPILARNHQYDPSGANGFSTPVQGQWASLLKLEE